MSSGDCWQCLEAFWVLTTGRTLLASSEQRAGMVLNVPQYTGQPHATKNHPAQNVTSAEVENPAIRH